MAFATENSRENRKKKSTLSASTAAVSPIFIIRNMSIYPADMAVKHTQVAQSVFFISLLISMIKSLFLSVVYPFNIS